MFQPFNNQGGTATMEPQTPGLNGQSRIPDYITGSYPQNPVTGGFASFGGYPNTTTQFVNPYFAMQNFGYAQPHGFYPTPMGWVGTTPNPYNCFPQMFGGTFNPITTIPFVGPFATVHPNWTTHPTQNPFSGLCHVPSPMFGFHPFHTTPTSFANYGGTGITMIPTPFGLRPVMTNFPTHTNYGYNPAAGFVDPVSAACCGTNYATPTPTGFGFNPNFGFGGHYNPFPTTPNTINTIANYGVNPGSYGWINPNWNALFNSMSGIPMNFGGCSPWNNGSGFGGVNVFPGMFQNGWSYGGSAQGFFNPNFCGPTSQYPNTTMASSTFNPITGTTNPFFSPTQVYNGIPGYNAYAGNGAGCGPVSCN